MNRRSESGAPTRQVSRALKLATGVSLVLMTGACELGGTTNHGPGDAFGTGDLLFGPGGIVYIGASIGEPCVDADSCRAGLTCDATGSCAPAGTAATGEVCAVAGECGSGLVCNSLTSLCVTEGDSLDGQACTFAQDCASGLRCQLIGVGGVCMVDDGTVDLGGDCEASSECLAPLLCGGGRCIQPAFGGIVPIPGAACAATDEDTGPYRAYFEVPEATPTGEFFRLPFPNDVRLTDDGVDMRGFYNPGTEVLGGDFIDAFIRGGGDGLDGFSPSATIYLRTSAAVDFDAVGAGGEGVEPTINFRNITPDSEGYDRAPGSWSWAMTTGRGDFICHNSIQVRGSWSSPMREGDTYAVWLSTDIPPMDADNPATSLAQDADFTAMMGSTAPSDPRLAQAWSRYAPFREYLTREGLEADDVATAAVFTVGRPSDRMSQFRAAIDEAPGGPLEELTLCDGVNESPCDDGASRGCKNEDTGYYEVHAKVSMPIFQAGTRPYLTPADGGAIEYTATGQPIIADTEDVCVSLAIPMNATMPEAGWPVVVYAHGTGGDFISHLRPQVAGALADATANEDTVNFVTVSIDGVMHGTRAGGSTIDPNTLFFNAANPVAARDNVLQGGADYYALVGSITETDLLAEASPTGDELRFDSDSVYFYGHSQGATVGALFAAIAPELRGVLLSGAGGGLVLSLLNKTSPVDLPAMVTYALGSFGAGGPELGSVSDRHPLLNLMQQWIDPADPINYAHRITASGPDDVDANHMLQIYGIGDTYTPAEVMAAFAGAANLTPLTPRLDELLAAAVSGPLSANRFGYTAAVKQYAPSGYDGHFVSTRDAAALDAIVTFFVTAHLDDAPTVD